MKLKVLGTVSPFNATHKTNGPGFLIVDGKNKIMLDCGSGVHRMLDIPSDMENLCVFLSHLHRDHYVDIFALQYASYTMHNLGRLKNPINIFLPERPISIFKDILSETAAYANYTVIDENTSVDIGGTTVSFCQTDHPIQTYAIKVKNGEETVVYTSDSSFTAKDRLVQFAQNADLLICESSLLKSYGFPESNPHMTAEQAGIIAKEANVKKLMLTHFWPEEDPNNFLNEAKLIFPNTITAKEHSTHIISKI